MGNHDIGFWELATAPYGPPAGYEDLGLSSSFHFDPITGSWLAQSFLSTVLPRAYIPPNSYKIASPCWPRGPLLEDARRRCTWGKFLLSDLCADNGLHPDFEPQRNEWQPFDILALGYKDIREQIKKDQNKMDGEYRKREQTGDSIGSWNETEEHANFFNTLSAQVVTVMKNPCFTFNRKPIKQVSTISLMPAPDTIRLVAKHLNPTLKDFREQYGPRPDLPSAFSVTTASSYYSSEGSYIVNPFHREDDQHEEHTASGSELDLKFLTSVVPSFEIPALPIKGISGTASTCANPGETSLCATPSIQRGTQLVRNGEAGVSNQYLACSESYESSESVFDSQPGESVQHSSDTNDPNTVPLQTFFLDSEEEENDEQDFSDETNRILDLLSHTISQTSLNTAVGSCLYEYTVSDNQQRSTPNPALPTTTAAIDAAECSLNYRFGLTNIIYPDLESQLLSTDSDLEPNRTPPLDNTTQATDVDTIVEERHSSALTSRERRRPSLVSFDLNIPSRPADRPTGPVEWVVHGARKVIHLAKRMNCVGAGADTEAPVARTGEKRRLVKEGRSETVLMRIGLRLVR